MAKRSNKPLDYICDICEKDATELDTWFGVASCDEHKSIPPVKRQQMGITATMRPKVN